jgi:hypothetical protein
VTLNRRSFILAAAIGVIGTASARAQGITRVTLDEFIQVSERLLRRSNLDRETAQIYLDALNADVNSAVTLAYIIQSNGNPTPEQAAMSATIVTWWNTGVYEIHGEPRLAARRWSIWPAYRPVVASELAGDVRR